MKHINKVMEFAKQTPVFDTKSVVRIVGNDSYAYVLLNYLLKTGEVKRLIRGYYTVHDDPALLVYCLRPAYIGLHWNKNGQQSEKEILNLLK